MTPGLNPKYSHSTGAQDSSEGISEGWLRAPLETSVRYLVEDGQGGSSLLHGHLEDTGQLYEVCQPAFTYPGGDFTSGIPDASPGPCTEDSWEQSSKSKLSCRSVHASLLCGVEANLSHSHVLRCFRPNSHVLGVWTGQLLCLSDWALTALGKFRVLFGSSLHCVWAERSRGRRTRRRKSAQTALECVIQPSKAPGSEPCKNQLAPLL